MKRYAELTRIVSVRNTDKKPYDNNLDYRGVIGVILINHGFEDFIIKNGDRIAQMVIARHEHAEWIEVSSLDETERGEGGFGHSGIK